LTGHEFDRNELLLRRAQWSSDHVKLVAIVVYYMFGPFLIALHTSKGRRFLGLPSDPPIVLLVQTMILIILTMRISLIHE
jgi:hypothetical protein